MKVKVTNPILDYENKPYQTGATLVTSELITVIEKLSKEEVLQKLKPLLPEPLTYRDVFNTALNTIIKDEVMTGQDKSKAFEITLKCFANKEPDFTTSQVEFIIARVEKVYLLPLIIGRIKEVFKES